MTTTITPTLLNFLLRNVCWENETSGKDRTPWDMSTSSILGKIIMIKGMDDKQAAETYSGLPLSDWLIILEHEYSRRGDKLFIAQELINETNQRIESLENAIARYKTDLDNAKLYKKQLKAELERLEAEQCAF